MRDYRIVGPIVLHDVKEKIRARVEETNRVDEVELWNMIQQSVRQNYPQFADHELDESNPAAADFLDRMAGIFLPELLPYLELYQPRFRGNSAEGDDATEVQLDATAPVEAASSASNPAEGSSSNPPRRQQSRRDRGGVNDHAAPFQLDATALARGFLAVLLKGFAWTGLGALCRMMMSSVREILWKLTSGALTAFVAVLLLVTLVSLMWKFKQLILLGLLHATWSTADDVLTPMCRAANDHVLNVCWPFCLVANGFDVRLHACNTRYLTDDKAGSEAEPPSILDSRQLEFGELALRNISQSPAIELEHSTSLLVQEAHALCDGLYRSVKHYSRELDWLIELSERSGSRTRRSLEHGIDDDWSWGDRLRSMVWSRHRRDQSAFETHLLLIEPQLMQVLKLDAHINIEMRALQELLLEITSRLRTAKRPVAELYINSKKWRSSIQNLFKIKTDRSAAVAMTFERPLTVMIKVGHAVDGTMRSVTWVQEKAQSLKEKARYHTTWAGQAQHKPWLMYLNEVDAAVKEMRSALLLWHEEDKRHEEFLFKSASDRLTHAHRQYADERVW